MDIDALRERLNFERQHVPTGGQWLEQTPYVTRAYPPGVSEYTVIHSRLLNADFAAVIRSEIEHAREKGLEVEWKVFGQDHPADLHDQLRRLGFECGPRELVLVCDVEPIATSKSDEHVRVELVDGPMRLAEFHRVASEVFGKDFGRTTRELAVAIEQGGTEHLGFIGYDGDVPVSVGRLYTHRESWFGGLYGGGTLATHRGKGVYRAVVRARALKARELGARYLVVDAMPTSEPILRRLGFVVLDETYPCQWRPKKEARGLESTGFCNK